MKKRREESNISVCMNLGNAGSRVRLGFVRKVYSILLTEISISLITCSLGILYPHLFELINHTWIMILAGVLASISAIMINTTSQGARIPYNYMWLMLFTLSESILVSSFLSFYNPKIVIIAVLLTFMVILALTATAFLSKSDYSRIASWISMIFILFITSAFSFFLFPSLYTNIIYLAMGIIVFGGLLIYQTHILIIDKKKRLHIDQYIMASIKLYVYIIQIFIRILKVLSKLHNEQE